MYRYDQFDHTIIQERVSQFRNQVQRRLDGDITENEFKPLRLQNGLYMQLHAYMLRVAIPYGLLSSKQLRMLAHIARTWDRGYGHFSTRQNIQYNWPRLVDVPDILAALASVEMHAVQTSGNCIRNVTSDHFAGVARDEIADPRPYCEVIRQWSTFHPEFAFLPRKFKIAVTGAPSNDRAAIRFHDIGLQLVRNDSGEIGFEVFVGGGMGRTPRVGISIRKFLAKSELLSYLEAIMRIYNEFGRRDNKFKARIKILVGDIGGDKFRDLVEEEWKQIRGTGIDLTEKELKRVSAYFAPPPYETLEDSDTWLTQKRLGTNRPFARWLESNVYPHQQAGYSIAMISLKPKGIAPGDCSDRQMDAIADLADQFSFGEIVVTHEQNLVFSNVKTTSLESLWSALSELGLAEANMGKVTDIICCPGLDYCNLANARSIPVSMRIRDSIDDFDYLHDLGPVTLNISGCINACGHHHVGNIGLLGINKQGEEFYQITLGGDAGTNASIGKILGPAFSSEEIVPAVNNVLKTYLDQRDSSQESFIEFVRRAGLKPFKENLYA